jgi:clathrin heavy chain
MFTELGIALTKYHPDRVFEHVKIFWTRLNMPKMIAACSEAHLWPELVFLYHHYEEFDNAVLAMMERAADAWDHNSLKEIIAKVTNIEIYYRAVTFYRDEHPGLLTDLLATLTARIDVNRVVTIFQKSDDIPLIKTWLINVQSKNKRTVNNAVHELLIEEEDYKTLRDSVNAYDDYDATDLAQRLEKHDLVFFRQIAANIWRKNKRWQKSIELSKQDKLYNDAIETAALSGKPEVVEELLRYVSYQPFIQHFANKNSSSILVAVNATLECCTLATTSSGLMLFLKCHGAMVSTTSLWYVLFIVTKSIF